MFNYYIRENIISKGQFFVCRDTKNPDTTKQEQIVQVLYSKSRAEIYLASLTKHQ